MKNRIASVIGKKVSYLIFLLLISQSLLSQDIYQSSDKTEAIFTENGAVKSHVLFNIYFESFHKMTLQEAENFNGNTYFANLMLPISHSTQIRIELPYFSEGDATLKEGGDPTHIKGYNGVFNLYSILIEHQFKSIEKNGFNFLGLFGAGYRLDPLETTIGDKYNHAGLTVMTGFRTDGNLGRNFHLLVNTKLTFWAISDDVGPSDKGWDWIGGADGWFLGNLSGAVMFPEYALFTPVAESRFMTDFLNYNTISTGPGLILSLKNVDFKAAVLIGLNNDAEDYRARFQVTIKTF